MTDGTAGSGPARSYHLIRSAVDAGESDELRERRAAIAELGDALRDLVEHASSTEAPPNDLRRAAEIVRTAIAPLAERRRQVGELPSADDLLGGVRMYNPACGPGSALAPPLRIHLVDELAVGTCTLGLAHEGPPMYAHGGISAMLLDQILGYVTSASGYPGMTVNLDTRYRAPVPLRTELRLVAEVISVDDRKVSARAIMTTAAEPERVLVEATGLFVALRPEQAAMLFGAALHPDASNPAVAHD